MVLVQCIPAQIKNSDDWLVNTREHNMLERLSQEFNFPDTEIPIGNAVVIANVEGPNLTLTVVGPKTGQAKAYAQAIEDWKVKNNFKGETLFSQENDCAAAVLVVKNGGFGKMEAGIQFKLSELRSALSPLEAKVRFALMAPKYTEMETTVPPGYTTRNGNRVWDATIPSPELETVDSVIKVQPWIVPTLAAWLFFPIIGYLFCFGMGILVAKNQSLTLEERRKGYAKYVGKGTFIVLGIHAAIVVATLPTGLLNPVSQVWFGTRFTQIGIIIVPFFAIVPMLLLPIMNIVERKVLGPTPSEQEEKEDFTEFQSDQDVIDAGNINPKIKRDLMIFIPIFVIAGVASFWPVPKESSVREFQRFPFIIVMLVSLISSIRRPKDITKQVVPNSDELLERVQSRIPNIEASIGCQPKSVRIGGLAYGPYGATISKEELVVSAPLAKRFTDEELDFVLAHELSHLKLGHLKKRHIAIFTPPVLFLLVFIPLIVVRALSGSKNPISMFVPFLGIILVMPIWSIFVSKMMRKQEMETDELAIQITRNPEAAISALMKMTQQNSLKGFDEVEFGQSHPKVSKRIEAIKAMRFP